MAQDATWFYADLNNKQHGPVPTEDIINLFNDGTLDGMSLVWAPHLPNWAPISDIPVLKAALQAADEEDEEDGDDPSADAASLSMPKEITSADKSAKSTESTQARAVANTPASVTDTKSDPGLSSARIFMYAPAGSSTHCGPIPQSSIESLCAAGYIDDDTLMWSAGMSNWEKFKELKASLLAPSNSDGAGEASSTATATKTNNSDSNAIAGKKRKRSQKSSGPQQGRENPWIFISGLPPDITEAQLADVFKIAGIIRLDYVTKEPRIIVQRQGGQPSTSALLSYLKTPSVELAVQLLDGTEAAPGYTMEVRKAKWKEIPKEDIVIPADNTTRKLTPEEQRAKIRALEQQAALSWAEEGDESLGLHVIVLKHMFDPAEVKDPDELEELASDIQGEAERFGAVDKLRIFSTHPEGVVTIKFHSAGAAAAALEDFRKRYFGGRKIEAEFWDGLTKFDAAAGGKAEEERLDEFGKWLEEEDAS